MVLPLLFGLSVPDTSGTTVDTVRHAGAVRLFVERATTVQSEFRLTDDNAADVAEITRRLDGLPLGIELAAARIAIFGAAQIVARLEDRFRLLSRGGRRPNPGIRRCVPSSTGATDC